MRATIIRHLEALKRRRAGDEGFSLIELIVVVAILGILVAIAIPVFGNIQGTAQDNALKTVAANGAAVVATKLANNEVPAAADVASLISGDVTGVAIVGTPTLADICVSATGYGKTFYAGNGALADGSACS